MLLRGYSSEFKTDQSDVGDYNVDLRQICVDEVLGFFMPSSLQVGVWIIGVFQTRFGIAKG